jgi:hypothetical protein
MDPSIGRNVHFVDEGGVHRAALVTGVRDDESVDLAVFPTRGFRNVDSVKSDERGKSAGTWHWPERQDEKPAAKK